MRGAATRLLGRLAVHARAAATSAESSSLGGAACPHAAQQAATWHMEGLQECCSCSSQPQPCQGEVQVDSCSARDPGASRSQHLRPQRMQRLWSNLSSENPSQGCSLHQSRRTHATSTAQKGQAARVSVSVQDTPVQFEAGVLALQADGACYASSGSSHVLATVCCDSAAAVDAEEVDGLPLQVDYTEGAYARGKVPEFGRRDRIDDDHVLCARAIDRAIRPLFPAGFRQPTHICARVLSAGGAMDPEVLAINAVSAALMCSDVPWHGPVGAVCVVRVDGKFQVRSAEPPKPSSGPAWARAASLQGTPGLALVQPEPVLDDFKLLYAGTADKVMMVELEADQATEDELREALQLAQTHVASLVEAQAALAAKAGKPKRRAQLLGATEHAEQLVKEHAWLLLEGLFDNSNLSKAGLASGVERVKAKVKSMLKARGLISDGSGDTPHVGPAKAMQSSEFAQAFETVLSDFMRLMALDKGRRLDGRGLSEIRPLSCDALPLYPAKSHGSALFNRGETQALAIATVGAVLRQSSWQALLDAPDDDQAAVAAAAAAAPTAAAVTPTATASMPGSAAAEEEAGLGARAPLLLHYEFPPYCVNEVGKINSMPSRREVGHGALALKALRPLMPDLEDFAFLVRLSAQTLSSNGSSSMAAVCGGSMALHMARVPMRELAAGISVGLVSENWPRPRAGPAPAGSTADAWPGLEGGYGRQALLVDIQGTEDGLGDMDLKVAGTRGGITAVQLDTKLPGLQVQLLCDAIAAARQAHTQLLDLMQEALQAGEARRLAQADVAVPQHVVYHVPEDLVEALVGPGGQSIQALQERTGTTVMVRPSGEAQIYAPSTSAMQLAMQGVKALEGTDLEEGTVYLARVQEVLDYGAVLEMASGAQHLLPISEVSHTKLRDIRDVLIEGQVLKVVCQGRDNKGLVRLSLKALLPVPAPPQQQQQQQQGKTAGESGSAKFVGRHRPAVPPRTSHPEQDAATPSAQEGAGADRRGGSRGQQAGVKGQDSSEQGGGKPRLGSGQHGARVQPGPDQAGGKFKPGIDQAGGKAPQGAAQIKARPSVDQKTKSGGQQGGGQAPEEASS